MKTYNMRGTRKMEEKKENCNRLQKSMRDKTTLITKKGSYLAPKSPSLPLRRTTSSGLRKRRRRRRSRRSCLRSRITS